MKELHISAAYVRNDLYSTVTVAQLPFPGFHLFKLFLINSIKQKNKHFASLQSFVIFV